MTEEVLFILHLYSLVKSTIIVFFTLFFLDFFGGKTCVFKNHGKPRALTSTRDGSRYLQSQSLKGYNFWPVLGTHSHWAVVFFKYILLHGTLVNNFAIFKDPWHSSRQYLFERIRSVAAVIRIFNIPRARRTSQWFFNMFLIMNDNENKHIYILYKCSVHISIRFWMLKKERKMFYSWLLVTEKKWRFAVVI